MRLQSPFAAFLTCLTLAGNSAAQSTSANVTFQVPLNITNLATDITKVRVTCVLIGAPLIDADRTGEVELPVSGRQVVTTAQVTVVVPTSVLVSNASGQTQGYYCSLSGYSLGRGWNPFTSGTSSGIATYNAGARNPFLVTGLPTLDLRAPPTFQW